MNYGNNSKIIYVDIGNSMNKQKDFTLSINKELLDLAYKNLLASSIAVFVNTIVLVYLLWEVVNQKYLIIWLSSILLLTTLRYFFAYLYHKDKIHYSIAHWNKIFLIGTLFAAMLWGVVPIVLFPDSLEHQSMLIIIIVGMGAGATSSLASHLSATRLFLFVMLIPLITRLFLEGYTIAFLATMFLILLLSISKQFYQNIYNTVKSKQLFEEAKDRLKVTQDSFQTIFNEAPAGIFYYGKDLKINQLNTEFSRILQVPQDKLIGLDINQIPDTRVIPTIQSVLDGTSGYYEGEYVTKIKQITIWITLRTSPIYNANREIIGGVGIMSDITPKVKAQKKIEYQAFYDALTNLPNRAMLNDRLQQALIRYKNHGMISALLFLDLDHFKKTNDSLGHSIGDELLKVSATRLSQLVSDEDVVARIGGDEFVIVLTNLGKDLSHAISTTEKVLQKIHQSMEEPFTLLGHTLNISTSIGIAVLNNSKDTAEDLLKYADTAMYQSKRDGRGRSSFYQDEMNVELKRRLDIENILYKAIETGELKVYYQPILEFKSKKVIGAEALIRLHSDELDDIYPDEFIPIAEETGLILSIGEWVLNRAIVDFLQWQAQYSEHTLQKIAINISTKQFANDNFIDIVKRVIQETKINPKAVELELTESIIIKDIKESISKMNQLRTMGIGVSIDDFGTGYSSLSYLKMLPFSSLKIDKSFTQDIHNLDDDQKLINTIISIAKSFNMDIVAEGVENDSQYNYLLERECDYFQGYYCSQAITAKEFEEFIKKKYNTPTNNE